MTSTHTGASFALSHQTTQSNQLRVSQSIVDLLDYNNNQDPTKADSSAVSLDDDSVSTGSTRSSSPQPHSISETEATFYYSGLPSSPKLIYRSGTTPWTESTGLKELRPVFGHELNAIWKKLDPEVCDYLDSVGVSWTSVDVVRFKVGEEEAVGPVVLWIGVLPKTLLGENAHSVACGCLNLLKKFGITDVEVEFRESIHTRSANLLRPVSNSDPTVDLRGPLTAALGLSIAKESDICIEGTGGFYLAEGGDNQKILLVTARHVLFPPLKSTTDTSNVDYTYTDTSAAPINVVLLGNEALDFLKKSITKSIKQRKEAAETYRSKIKIWSERWLPIEDENGEVKLSEEAETIVNKYTTLLDEENRAVDTLQEFEDNVTNGWHDKSQRILGHVVRSPPLSCGIDSSGFTEDYAVVELDTSKIQEAFMGNVVDLGSRVGTNLEIPVDQFTLMMRDHRPDAPTTFEYPNNRLLELQDDIIPEEDMCKPVMLDHEGLPCLHVIKNGFNTGVTIGRANGIFSKTRHYLTDGTAQTSTEWAILSYDKTFSPFSFGGDSGSIIVDGRGRMGGLLTGGSKGKTTGLDITYATPLFWLLPRIKAQGFPHAHHPASVL